MQYAWWYWAGLIATCLLQAAILDYVKGSEKPDENSFIKQERVRHTTCIPVQDPDGG